MKFKVGDKVKVIKSLSASWNRQTLGKTGVVTKRRGEGLMVSAKFDYDVNFISPNFSTFCMEDELDFDNGKIVGYRLIREYPGSEILSSISSEDWSKHPEFWEPIYEEVVEFEGYAAEYCQNGVMFGCKSITIKDLDVVHKILLLSEELNIAGFNLLDALLKGKINLNIVEKLFVGIEATVIMKGDTLEELKEKKAADLPF